MDKTAILGALRILAYDTINLANERQAHLYRDGEGYSYYLGQIHLARSVLGMLNQYDPEHERTAERARRVLGDDRG